MSSWIVMKLGPADAADPATWRTFAALVRRRSQEGLRPLVILPALAGIPELLWKGLGGYRKTGGGRKKSAAGRREDAHINALSIAEPHLKLAQDLGLPEEDAKSLLAPDLLDLVQTAWSAVLDDEASARSQVMSFAERMVCRIATAFFNLEGIPAAWHDACQAVRVPKGGPRTGGPWEPVPADGLLRRLEALPRVVVTQDGVAGGYAGKAVRIEPGGGDVSAAYLAAWLEAQRCEIWSDRAGLFTTDPARLSSARLLRSLDYGEAQEYLALGGPGPHPLVIPPLRHHRIPLHLGWLRRPEAPGTVVSKAAPVTGSPVKAIAARTGLTLFSLEALSMWQHAGFLAEAFGRFARHGLSVDCVSTSQSNVTVSLDPAAQGLDEKVMAGLLRDLERSCSPRVVAPVTALSLVGRRIHAVLPELAPLRKDFGAMEVHLVTESASGTNLTLIVDEDQGEDMLRRLHALFVDNQPENEVFGPAWSGLSQDRETGTGAAPAVAAGA